MGVRASLKETTRSRYRIERTGKKGKAPPTIEKFISQPSVGDGRSICQTICENDYGDPGEHCTPDQRPAASLSTKIRTSSTKTRFNCSLLSSI